MRRTREQALATRATIIDAAQRVFYERGVVHASLDEIARRAGVTRGAVYGHFKNKFALLDAIFEATARPLDPFSVTLSAHKADPIEELLEELQRCWREVTHSARIRRLYALVFTRCENAKEAAPFCKRVVRASRCSERRIEEWLRYAMSVGRLPSQFDAQTVARVVHATLSGLLRRQLMDSTSWDSASIDIVGIVRALLQRQVEP